MSQGTHLIADLYGCRSLDDQILIELAMREAVVALGATLIGLKVHKFGGGGGVTGVALLAESHISIHTWPEHSYAALDIFVCGLGQDIAPAADIIAAQLGCGSRRVKILSRSMDLNRDHD